MAQVTFKGISLAV